MTRKEITQADIDRYNQFIDQGKSGIDQMYRDMERKGYQSATWAKDEFRQNTAYGAANAVYLNNQTGKELDNATADKLYADIASETLRILTNQVRDGNGSTTEDLNYDLSRQARKNAYQMNGYQDAKWFWEDPMTIKQRGEKIQQINGTMVYVMVMFLIMMKHIKI